jgi:hypothetical protein
MARSAVSGAFEYGMLNEVSQSVPAIGIIAAASLDTQAEYAHCAAAATLMHRL